MRDALAHRDYTINGSEVHIDIYDDRMELYSPGGMPDGSFIQDRDPLTIPSTKRNPISFVIFNYEIEFQNQRFGVAICAQV